MRKLMLVLPLAMMAACKQEPSVSVDNATAQEVAAEVKKSGIAGEIMKPGQWQYTMTLVDMSAPGMPPEALARMKQMMNSSKVTDKCVTAEDVRKMDSAMGDVPKNCTFDHYEIGGGKIDGKMTCSNAGRVQQTKVSGSYTEGSSDVTATSTMTGAQGPMGNMTVTMNMKGKRIGDCK